MLIALCTTWCCKNKNYFCSLERSRPSVRKHGSTTSGDDNEQGGGGSGTLIVGGGGEATGRRSSCSSSKFSKRLLHTDTRNYKESAKGSADETKSEDTEAFRYSSSLYDLHIQFLKTQINSTTDVAHRVAFLS
jgi:hypothetical protein